VDETAVRMAWEAGHHDLAMYRREMTLVKEKLDAVLEIPPYRYDSPGRALATLSMSRGTRGEPGTRMSQTPKPSLA
jgi:hypothetical protein